MPIETGDNNSIQTGVIEKKDSGDKSLINETTTAHLLQIFGNQAQQYVPTQAQVDKILSLQEKGMDYTHSERICYSPRQKMEVIGFCVVVFVILGIFIFSVFYVPQYLSEIISGIFGLLGGATGGYGIGKRRKKNGDE